MGENPIKKTIKLKTSESSSSYLELKTDGTALCYFYSKEYKKCTEAEYAYKFNIEKREIYMVLKKIAYNEGELITYNEILSKINEDYADEEVKQFAKDDYKARFGAQITYAYKITDGKMTLTEKFTGVKNLLDSECEFRAETGYDSISIGCCYARRSIKKDDFYYYYYGTLDTDKRTIDFEKRKETRSDNGDYEYEALGNVNATYLENISEGTVTIKFKDKEYVCEFEGEVYTQVE